MKIGVMLAGVNTKFWTTAGQAAEDAGFESVWLPEHLVFPVEMKGSPHDGDSHPPIPSNTPAFDALMALAAIAATTKNVRPERSERSDVMRSDVLSRLSESCSPLRS